MGHKRNKLHASFSEVKRSKKKTPFLHGKASFSLEKWGKKADRIRLIHRSLRDLSQWKNLPFEKLAECLR